MEVKSLWYSPLMGLWVDSEVGTLRKVIVHSPGSEIEVMSPEAAQQVLFNDIIPLQVVAKEHRELTAFLSIVSEVYQIQQLLTDIVKKDSVRRDIEEALLRQYGARHRQQALRSCSPEELSEICIHGLRKKAQCLYDYLSTREFDILPLPNLFFTRDSAMVYKNSIIVASMASGVRNMESEIMYHICKNHPLFQSESILYAGNFRDGSIERIEGGDLIIISEKVFVIGISERTNTAAADVIMKEIVSTFGDNITVFAVLLPEIRATIHLDMVFTLIDRNQVLLYHPLIVGRERCRVVRIDVDSKGSMRFVDVDNVLSGLKEAGFEMEYVSCGGPEPLKQKREQWMSGANMFAFAPGKVLGYGANEATFEALHNAGYVVRKASDFIAGSEEVASYDRLAVQLNAIELARGGGGIRCMTMPLERA